MTFLEALKTGSSMRRAGRHWIALIVDDWTGSEMWRSVENGCWWSAPTRDDMLATDWEVKQ